MNLRRVVVGDANQPQASHYDASQLVGMEKKRNKEAEVEEFLLRVYV